MAPQLGFIGLGNMGMAMARNLIRKGSLESPLMIFNRTKSRAEDLKAEQDNCTIAESALDLVKKCDIIFTSLTDDAAVGELYSEIMQNVDVQKKTFVECSTITPDAANTIGVMAVACFADLVTMPVFGEPGMAERGVLTCIPCGASKAVEKIKPYLVGIIGRNLIDFSDEPHEKAALLKIIGNIFIVGMIETLAQGHTMAEKTGLGHENLHKFVQAVFPGGMEVYSTRFMTGDYFNRERPHVSIDMAIDLASQVLGLAKDNGVKLRSYEVSKEHLEAVKTHKGALGDIAGIYGAVRQESGLPYKIETETTKPSSSLSS